MIDTTITIAALLGTGTLLFSAGTFTLVLHRGRPRARVAIGIGR